MIGGYMSYDSAFGQFMHSVFGGFDMSIFAFFGSIQNDFFTLYTKVFTCFGEPIFIYLFGALCCFLCLFKKTRKIAMMLLVGLGLFVVCNDLLVKNITLRLRPYNALQWNADFFNWYMNAGPVAESPYCFASGHTIFTVCSSILFYLWVKKDLKKPEAILIFLVPLFTATSRLYLMVHYPTDVIFGIFEGILYAVAAWYIAKLTKFLHSKIKNEKIKNFSIDLQPWVEKKFKLALKPSRVSCIVVITILFFFAVSGTKFFMDQTHHEHCAHQGPDYICMNEAHYKNFNEQTGQWEEYCRIHK